MAVSSPTTSLLLPTYSVVAVHSGFLAKNPPINDGTLPLSHYLSCQRQPKDFYPYFRILLPHSLLCLPLDCRRRSLRQAPDLWHRSRTQTQCPRATNGPEMDYSPPREDQASTVCTPTKSHKLCSMVLRHCRTPSRDLMSLPSCSQSRTLRLARSAIKNVLGTRIRKPCLHQHNAV